MTVSAPHSRVRDCLVAIENGQCNLALAVDEHKKLVGVISDGDLRRFLLRGGSLQDQTEVAIMGQPKTAEPTWSRERVLEEMKRHGLRQLPVVNTLGQVEGLHLLDEFVTPYTDSVSALILAGGKGSRLGSVTQYVPKPMLKIAGTPIIERIVKHLRAFGIRDITISVGHLKERIMEHFDSDDEFRAGISFLEDGQSSPLGTGGPLLSYVRDREVEGSQVLVVNGDLVVDFDVYDLTRFHFESSAACTVVGASHAVELPYGVVRLNQDGLIEGIEEKPYISLLVNAGIYLWSIDKVPGTTVGGCDMPDLISEAIDLGERVACWTLGPEWIDIGTPLDLMRARGRA